MGMGNGYFDNDNGQTLFLDGILIDIMVDHHHFHHDQVEGGQQHLLVDQQHNPLALARRPSTDLLPLVSVIFPVLGFVIFPSFKFVIFRCCV